MTGEQVSGFFISFPPDVCTEILAALGENGYTEDIDGLKNYITESLLEFEDEEESATESVKNKVRSKFVDELGAYINQHPEEIAGYLNLGKSLLSKVVKQKRQPKN